MGHPFGGLRRRVSMGRGEPGPNKFPMRAGRWRRETKKGAAAGRLPRLSSRRWWARSRNPDPVCPSRALRDGSAGGRRRRRPPDPPGIARPFEAFAKLPSRHSVHGSRHVVSTTSRHSGVPPSGAEAPEAPMDFSFPSGYAEPPPSRPSGPDSPHGVSCLYSDAGAEVHGPGRPARFVPPSGFPTLLTVSSLHAFRPRGPVPLVRFTLQSVSPPRSRTPFGAVALLPFPASRAPALRTRSSRCPAAPGPCSPRRSVSTLAEARADRCSHGVRCLSRAFPPCREGGFPTSSLLRFSTQISRRPALRRFRDLTRTGVGRPLAGAPDSLEVLHQDLSSVSPDDSGVPSESSDRK